MSFFILGLSFTALGSFFKEYKTIIAIIGGIIIIDYIDMQEKENEEKIIELLKENLKKDRSKTQIAGFSKLNLLEMTRKHMCSND